MNVYCRFCQCHLIEIGATSIYNSGGYKTISHTRRCNDCQATQSFDPDGNLICYSFEVKPYILMFDLKENLFTISERSNMAEKIVASKCIPNHLTPQNTTLEKIKTYILFS